MMSALGTKRTNSIIAVMSAYQPEKTYCQTGTQKNAGRSNLSPIIQQTND